MKLVTPASMLFVDDSNSREICEASTSLELRPELRIPVREWQYFSHCHFSDSTLDINLKWGVREKENLEKLLSSVSDIPSTLSFHLARDYDGIRTNEDGRYVPAGRLMERDEMLSNTAENTQWLRNHFESEILIENNNYYCTGAYDVVTDAEFVSDALLISGAGFLFDFAHALVSAHNRKTDLSQYVGGLPLERVKQIHVSAPTLQRGEMVDSHELPDVAMVLSAVRLVSNATNETPAVSIEYYKDARQLIELLRRLGEEEKTLE